MIRTKKINSIVDSIIELGILFLLITLVWRGTTFINESLKQRFKTEQITYEEDQIVNLIKEERSQSTTIKYYVETESNGLFTISSAAYHTFQVGNLVYIQNRIIINNKTKESHIEKDLLTIEEYQLIKEE